MPAPVNQFKKAILAGQRQLGLWVALANPVSTELCATAGFDWLLIDAEHGPNDIRSTLFQLQAASAHPASAVVRIPAGDPVMVKQMLDIGAQTLLVPMINTAKEAQTMASAMRYPPNGFRGIGAALARASAYNSIPDYLQTADDEVCLIVQAETMTLRRRASEKSPAVARLAPGMVAGIERCDRQWCRVSVRAYSGWLRRDGLWGVAPNETIE